MERRYALLETAIMCFQRYRLAIPNVDDPAGDERRSGSEANNCEGNEIQALIGANLKRLRKQRGLSRRRLACLAQVRRSTLRDLERGAATPGIGMLWKLARALGVPCIAFIEGGARRTAFDVRRGRSGLHAIDGAIGSIWRLKLRDPEGDVAR
jgi:transcriptional regulator with XRE-family HTH domain